MWIIDANGLTNTEFIALPSKPHSISYPAVIWRIENGNITNGVLPDDVQMGAFCNCSSLKKVSIPESVKKIGEYAFRNTALKSVKIAADCEYYPTSFPDNCEITFYETNEEV